MCGIETGFSHTVSILGKDKGCTIKLIPCLKKFPRAKPEGTPKGKVYT